MEGADFKESEAESVIKVAREPAIIINGFQTCPLIALLVLNLRYKMMQNLKLILILVNG